MSLAVHKYKDQVSQFRCEMYTGTLAKLREMEQFYAGRSFIRLQSRIQKEQQISSSYNHKDALFCLLMIINFNYLNN